MYGRVIRTKGDPSKAEEAIKNWTSQILPLIKKQKGFLGASLMANRKAGEGMTVTYWETEQAMKTAREQVRPEAVKILATTGSGIVDDHECEVAVQERFQPPKANVWVRVTTIEGDPTKIDEGISRYKSSVVPFVKKQPGARAAILLVDRKGGVSFSGSIWDTENDLQNSEAAAGSIRKEIADKIAAKSTRVEVFEVAYTEILTPTPAR